MTLCLLALGLTAALTGSAAVTEGSYRSMKVFGDWLVAPLALLTLASGLLLSLGTHWGLARHRWVWVKFWLTGAAALASVLFFRVRIDQTVTDLAAGRPVLPYELVIPPAVSLSAYAFMMVVSVLKPWGLTARGRRHRSTAAARRTAPSASPGAGGRRRARWGTRARMSG